MTNAEYQQFLLRTQKKSPETPVLDGVDRERDLHDDIIDYCNNQWPRWLYIHARMDKRSTIAVGANDFTIFASGGRTFCIECKRKNEKLDPDQLIWQKEMEMLGHRVFVCRNMDEFREVVK